MLVIEKYISDIEKCIEDFNINIESFQSDKLDGFLYTDSLKEYKKLFLDLLLCTSEEGNEQKTKALVDFTIEHDISYLFLYSELVTVVRKLLSVLLQNNDLDNIKELDSYFAKHEYQITTLYLQIFLTQLQEKCELRISHINSMPNKKLMIHYENHLRWIINLILYIQEEKFDDNYPEINPNLCDFGKWLKGNTTSYLVSTSHFQQIDRLHVNLHDLAENVIKSCKSKAVHAATLIHLMQRIYFYSLEIGNEIAFLNHIDDSSKDPLTHLLNRRLFNKIMLNKLEITKVTDREFSLIMCDLDHFKIINDTYGHVVGDMVIKHFANILVQTLRKSDYIFRFGGEEFMVILPMTDKEDALQIAQKICDITVSTEVVIDEITFNYTVSIGTITIQPSNVTIISQESVDKYIIQVDEKLYLAKEKGRNRVE